jgi:hypothetical protein
MDRSGRRWVEHRIGEPRRLASRSASSTGLTPRLPPNMRRRFGLAFAPDSGSRWPAGSPHTPGPGLVVPIAPVVLSRLDPARLLPAAMVLGDVLGVLLLPAGHARRYMRSAAELH